MDINISDFEEEMTTVWSFPERGRWKTHDGGYRGNFAPQIPRNLILRYTKEDDIILDPMVGGGTTLVEAKLLNRRSIGFDINPEAVNISVKRISFSGNYKYEPIVKLGDARNLKYIDDEYIDLIIIHPPYLNIIKYSNGEIKEDFSNYNSVDEFINDFKKVVAECYRVLKNNCYCAILIDTRRKGYYIPFLLYVRFIFAKVLF